MRRKTSPIVWLIAILFVVLMLGDMVAMLLPALEAPHRHRP